MTWKWPLRRGLLFDFASAEIWGRRLQPEGATDAEIRQRAAEQDGICDRTDQDVSRKTTHLRLLRLVEICHVQPVWCGTCEGLARVQGHRPNHGPLADKTRQTGIFGMILRGDGARAQGKSSHGSDPQISVAALPPSLVRQWHRGSTLDKATADCVVLPPLGSNGRQA